MIRAALLLVGALLAYGWFLGGGRRRVRPGGRYARMAWRLTGAFGATSLIALLLLGRVGVLAAMPAEFAGAQHLASELSGMPRPMPLPLGTMVAAMVAGGVIAGLVARWRKRGPVTLGRIEAVLPRRPAELGWGVLVSLDAGICEEMFFRLLLPLLGALVTGSAILGFAGSAVLFAWAHRYQGAVGVAATFVLAWLLTAAYLVTGSLWTAMVLHAAIDVNGLVIRPVVAGIVRR